MAERCCRARRCVLVSPVAVVSRAVSRRLARAVGLIATVVDGMSVEDVGGIAGVDGMSRVDAEASAQMRRVPRLRGRMLCRRSSMRSRVG